MALGVVRSALYPDLTDPLAVLVGNVVGVAILSWLLMPVLTQRFDTWLRR
jgi:antibiotic biosynthesis monooxygenase (ABM) superfamily enzyme